MMPVCEPGWARGSANAVENSTPPFYKGRAFPVGGQEVSPSLRPSGSKCIVDKEVSDSLLGVI